MKRVYIKLKERLSALLVRLGLLTPGKVMYVGGSDTLPAPLKREEEARLIERLEAGDVQARNQLIEHNLRLVAYIARRFENTGIHIEDLISIGTIGLIKAVGTYQPAKAIKLATYASRCIENEILMYLRKTANQKTELSFDEPLNTDWDGNELLLSDVLGTDEDLVVQPLEADVDRQLLRQAIERLDQRDYTALWSGRPEGVHPEGGGRPAGDFPILHLPAGKANHCQAEKGNRENDVKAWGKLPCYEANAPRCGGRRRFAIQNKLTAGTGWSKLKDTETRNGAVT